MSSVIPSTPAFINPRDLNRLGVDLCDSVGPDFRSPLFDILKIPHDTQLIIAEYCFSAEYNRAFAPAVMYRLYHIIYQQCSTDHRIKHLIPWDPEVLEYTCPNHKTRLSSSSRNLVIQQKVSDLWNRIETLARRPYINPDTPELAALVKKKAFADFEFGARAELYALIYLRKEISHQVPTHRANNLSAAVFRLNPRMYLGVGLTRFGIQSPLAPHFRAEMLIQLCAHTIIYGLDHPNVPIDQLPFPQEIPKELPGIPGQQPPQPAPPVAAQPVAAQPVNPPPAAAAPLPQPIMLPSPLLFVAGLVAGVAIGVLSSLFQNTIMWIRNVPPFVGAVSFLTSCVALGIGLGTLMISLYEAPTFRSTLKVVAVAFGGAACGFIASPYALNRLLR